MFEWFFHLKNISPIFWAQRQVRGWDGGSPFTIWRALDTNYILEYWRGKSALNWIWWKSNNKANKTIKLYIHLEGKLGVMGTFFCFRFPNHCQSQDLLSTGPISCWAILLSSDCFLFKWKSKNWPSLRLFCCMSKENSLVNYMKEYAVLMYIKYFGDWTWQIKKRAGKMGGAKCMGQLNCAIDSHSTGMWAPQ